MANGFGRCQHMPTFRQEHAAFQVVVLVVDPNRLFHQSLKKRDASVASEVEACCILASDV